MPQYILWLFTIYIMIDINMVNLKNTVILSGICFYFFHNLNVLFICLYKGRVKFVMSIKLIMRVTQCIANAWVVC